MLCLKSSQAHTRSIYISLSLSYQITPTVVLFNCARVHKLLTLHQFHIGTPWKPARMLRPRIILWIPMPQATITMETTHLITPALIVETRLCQHLGRLNQFGWPGRERIETWLEGGVTGSFGGGVRLDAQLVEIGLWDQVEVCYLLGDFLGFKKVTIESRISMKKKNVNTVLANYAKNFIWDSKTVNKHWKSNKIFKSFKRTNMDIQSRELFEHCLKVHRKT